MRYDDIIEAIGIVRKKEEELVELFIMSLFISGACRF